MFWWNHVIIFSYGKKHVWKVSLFSMMNIKATQDIWRTTYLPHYNYDSLIIFYCVETFIAGFQVQLLTLTGFVFDWLLNRPLNGSALLGKHSSVSLRLRFHFHFQFGPQATWSPSSLSFQKNVSISLFIRVICAWTDYNQRSVASRSPLFCERAPVKAQICEFLQVW